MLHIDDRFNSSAQNSQIIDFILSFSPILVLCVRLWSHVTVSVTQIRIRKTMANSKLTATADSMQEIGVELPVEAA
jgi:hypothetical protein